VRLDLGGLIAGGGAVGTVAFDLDRVARGINRLERALALELNFDADVFDGRTGEFVRAEGEDIADEAVVGLEELGVGEVDALLAVRFDGEDADFETVTAD